MPQLMAIADEVLKLKAVCVECGQDAGYTYKLTDDGKTIDVGGAEKYVPLCLDCWLRHRRGEG
jgi:thymidine kinase